jgi:hypothetical protein
MSLLMFLMAAQGLPVTSVATDPPAVMVTPALAMRAPPITIDVEVRAAGEALWSGQMRVSGRSGASFSRQQSNAGAAGCEPVEGYYESSARTSLSINMSSTRRSSNTEGIDVRVNWDRPSEADSCQGRRGTRSVAIQETVIIKQGDTVTVTGDGGLTIKLHRH